jgi:hypothetical protein
MGEQSKQAALRYCDEVQKGVFPDETQHSYAMISKQEEEAFKDWAADVDSSDFRAL